MARKGTKKQPAVSYEELSATWWVIYNGYVSIEDFKIREYTTRKAFEALLSQCGWTIEEWNKETDSRSKNKSSKD